MNYSAYAYGYGFGLAFDAKSDEELAALPDSNPEKQARIAFIKQAIQEWQKRLEGAKFKDQYSGRPSFGGTYVKEVEGYISGWNRVLRQLAGR